MERLHRLSVGHTSLISSFCLRHECIWGSLCYLGRNTCTHVRMHMHTNVLIHTDKVFISMRNEACDLLELLFFFFFCIKLCIGDYDRDFRLQIVDDSVNDALKMTVVFLNQRLERC